ncbi:MAG: hypothetical protein ACI8WB_002336 [Phenylobacterium sp.]|jgi:hypothetical protein
MPTLEEPYWEDADFIRFDSAMLQSKGFSLESINSLSKKGLPEWAAPNINFDYYKPNNTHLKIGTDRNALTIYIRFDTMAVWLELDEIFINSNPVCFREALKLYAEMVDKATLVDEDSFINNDIPDELINIFKAELTIIDKKAMDKGSFWVKEIERLLSR